MSAEIGNPVYCLGLETVQRVAREGKLETDLVNFIAADDLFHKNVTTVTSVDLAAKILEVAQLHDDDENSGKVFMPDEEEWGEIIGMARAIAKA